MEVHRPASHLGIVYGRRTGLRRGAGGPWLKGGGRETIGAAARVPSASPHLPPIGRSAVPLVETDRPSRPAGSNVLPVILGLSPCMPGQVQPISCADPGGFRSNGRVPDHNRASDSNPGGPPTAYDSGC